MRCSDHEAELGERRVGVVLQSGRLGHAEVGDHRVAAAQQDVLRLDVPVDHAAAMGIGQGVGHLRGDGQRLVHREVPQRCSRRRSDSPSMSGMVYQSSLAPPSPSAPLSNTGTMWGC